MEQQLARGSNVVSITTRPALREPPITSAEIAEYRKLRPALLRMLADWETLTASSGCPIAHQIVHGR